MSDSAAKVRTGGMPCLYLRLKIGRRLFSVKFLPDWWWRKAWCERGRCAYGNLWCPNGCPEEVDLDA